MIVILFNWGKYEELYNLGVKRRLTKQFDSTKNVNEKDIFKIMEFAKTTPSAKGLEIIRIINISRESKLKNELNKFMKKI